jgi:dTDP-4-dehydrorhamnose 3,5-epimerase
MIVKDAKLKGCFVLESQIFSDKRGYFSESFNQKKFNAITRLNINFVQDNESQSLKGVLRGLHYQKGDHAQAKLIKVVKGKILDVVVDLRLNSKTFGEHFSLEISENNKLQFFIPRGFAHGFLAIEDNTIVNYKCDNYYNKKSESGIIYNDVDLGIDWDFENDKLIISDKDLLLPTLKDVKL